MKRARVLLLLLACVSFTSAQSPQDNVAQKLVGAWRLVSAEGTDPTFHLAYDHATGVIIYDRSGWMSAQIDIKGTRKPFVNGAAGGTNEEKVAAFDTYLAYYGKYTLDLKAQTVTHHVEDDSQPNWRGIDNVRWFEVQGNDRLLLIPNRDSKGVIDRKNATFKLCGSASSSGGSMIKVTLLYPNAHDTRFDVEYYLQKHMPPSIELLGPGDQSVSVEIGLTGGLPGEPAPFVAICAFTCESIDAFRGAFRPHAEELQGDIPNYTNSKAIIQLSELRIAQ